jgi:hypothetical protein
MRIEHNRADGLGRREDNDLREQKTLGHKRPVLLRSLHRGNSGQSGGSPDDDNRDDMTEGEE